MGLKLKTSYLVMAPCSGAADLAAYAEASFIVTLMPDGLSGSALLHVFILIFMFGYLASSWNILGGFAGQLSLGHAAFFGIGAYTSSLLYVHFGLSPWIGMFAGAAWQQWLAMVLVS